MGLGWPSIGTLRRTQRFENVRSTSESPRLPLKAPGHGFSSLGRCARTLRYQFVPSPQCCAPIRQRKIDGLRGEINRDQRSDVGDRIVLTRYEGYVSQPRIEIGEEVFHPQFAALDQFRDLFVVMGAGDRAAFETWHRIANALHDCSESFQFDASFPHRHQRSLLRGFTMQRCLWIDFLEIAQDRRYFTDGRAVLQYQGRNHPTRIDGAIRVGMLLTFAEIDRYERY